jgi:hypothetical protein
MSHPARAGYRITGAALGFGLLTAWLHRDILRAPSDCVLGGYQVGGYFSWVFWWWSYALRHHLPLLYTRFLMFPRGVPLFFHSPVNDLCAVLLQMVTTPYAATNLLLIVGYALTGATAFALFHRLTKDTPAALCGAFCYAFSAYMLVQHWLGQVGEATIFFNPLLIIALDRLLERPSWGRAGWLFLALSGVVLADPYVAFCFGFIYLSAWLSFDVLFGDRRVLRPAVARSLAVVIAGALLVAAVAYWPLLRYRGQWLGGAAFFSIPLSSFALRPFWHFPHPAPAQQPWYPEQLMGYLGLGSYALLAYGLCAQGLRRSAAFKFWFWVLCCSGVLTLGPLLTISPDRQTRVPLPYLLLRGLPVLGDFRVAGRILMTTTLASGAITALALSWLLKGRSVMVRALCAGLFLGLWFWEFDLPSLQAQAVSCRPTRIYEALKQDRGTSAILELPDYYDASGDLIVLAQSYMLLQVYHEHPLVLGSPSRYLRSSLDSTETTPYLRELTHPWLLVPLAGHPQAGRPARQGARILRGAGIGYVVFHSDSVGLTAAGAARMREWLDAGLGAPAMQDGGVLLYRTDRNSL